MERNISNNYTVIPTDDALCKEIDPELWFPQHKGTGGLKDSYFNMRTAKQFCLECPIVLNCLMSAVKTQELHGIWGGSTPRERRYITTVEEGRAFLIKLRKQVK